MVGVLVGVVVVALVEVATTEEDVVAKLKSMRRLETATPTLRPPMLIPRRGDAVALATRRKRGVVKCIVKIRSD